MFGGSIITFVCNFPVPLHIMIVSYEIIFNTWLHKRFASCCVLMRKPAFKTQLTGVLTPKADSSEEFEMLTVTVKLIVSVFG